MSSSRTMAVVAGVLAAGVGCGPAPLDAPSSTPPADCLPLTIDPDFDPTRLSASERVWNDRLWAALDASQETVDRRARSNDVYRLGRYVGNYTASLVMALRATGDRRFLDRAIDIWESAERDLSDAWADGRTDGFRNWQMQTVTSPDFRGRDTHAMDEAMTHGNLALVAFAAAVNRDVSPRYAKAADRWRAYLENEFLAKWTSRAGDAEKAWHGDRGFYKRFTHPRANQLRLAVYLEKLTGDPAYRAHAARCIDDLVSAMSAHPLVAGGRTWSHHVSGWNEGAQKIGYAQYMLRVVLDLAHDGVPAGVATFPDRDAVAAITRTIRDGWLAGSDDRMPETVDGDGEVPRRLYALAGFARWDDTGRILEAAEPYAEPTSEGVSVAAYALSAVSRRGRGS